jgi:hypothetical protein
MSFNHMFMITGWGDLFAVFNRQRLTSQVLTLESVFIFFHQVRCFCTHVIVVLTVHWTGALGDNLIVVWKSDKWSEFDFLIGMGFMSFCKPESDMK